MNHYRNRPRSEKPMDAARDVAVRIETFEMVATLISRWGDRPSFQRMIARGDRGHRNRTPIESDVI